MKRFLLSSCLLAGSVSLSHAVAIFAPGDAVIGGARVASNFEVGVVGTAAGTNNWPGAEVPEDLINGLIGGGGEKYLNFLREDTGIIITPAFGPSIVSSMELWVANDAVERDPASFEILGTNSVISGDGPFAIGDFTLISSGDLALPDTRDTVSDMSGFSQTVAIGDGNAYSTYMILFPTTKGVGNSMQLSEIQFDGMAIPEPGSASLLALSLGALLFRRKR
ncbi:MAG: PEP-CTERM sorting domain-containing protein [Verrucomicrobiales bacterium]